MIRRIFCYRSKILHSRDPRSIVTVLDRHNNNAQNVSTRFIRKFSYTSFPISRSVSLPMTEAIHAYLLSPTTMKNMNVSNRSWHFMYDTIPNDRSNLRITRTKTTIRKYIPRKAAVKLTENSRAIFKKMLQDPPRSNIIGIMLNYEQSKSGEPRMVYNFQFVTSADINDELDEGVSLEVIKVKKKNSNKSKITATSSTTTIDDNNNHDDDDEYETIPKPPADSDQDGLPKLYIHHNAFLKVLGATVDIDVETLRPILYDREGNLMDPNA